MIANGVYGYRGTLDEDDATKGVAWNINGLYDRVGEAWRESVNLYNPLYTILSYRGNPITLSDDRVVRHKQQLGLSKGQHVRNSVIDVDGTQVHIHSERFADQHHRNLLHASYAFSCDQPLTLELYSGIDGIVYDLSGSHLENTTFDYDESFLIASGQTQEQKIPVHVIKTMKVNFDISPEIIKDNNKVLRRWQLTMEPGRTYKLSIHAGMIIGDGDIEDLKQSLSEAKKKGYNHLLADNKEFWDEKWHISDVDVGHHDKADKALTYAIYMLISHRPPSEDVSIPARGLSGQVYKGAVFWDTEMYMFPFYLNTDQAAARNILRYRINGLSGAKQKAKEYGYKGAFYAWESQENGYDACSDYNLSDPDTGKPVRTYFKENQIHINGAIAYALNQYVKRTGDVSILYEGGLEMLFETAVFYADRVKQTAKTKYECFGVMGPDEYHEHVNNNAYTNVMIYHTLDVLISSIVLLRKDDREKTNAIVGVYQKRLKKIRDVRRHILMPKPNEDGLIEQFDGYFELNDVTPKTVLKKKRSGNEYLGGKDGLATPTQVIKQADVILLLVLFPGMFPLSIQRANLDYYATRTEHGSTLSKAMYAQLAARLGKANDYFDMFLEGASVDLTGEYKDHAGGTYIGGTHLAACGGAYMTTVYGFAGLKHKKAMLMAESNMPKAIRNLHFRVNMRGNIAYVTIRRNIVTIKWEETT